MTQPVTIALDAMGGDRAPDMVVKGANVARVRHPEARFLLFGDEARIRTLLDRHRKLAAVSEIRHAEDVVGGDDRPSAALRRGRRTSMRKAIDAVKAGEADGIVSAGNTGALMAMAKTVLKMLPGIHRPAIASIAPTLRGEVVMLDLGANIECTADNLVQFAIMGEVFARTVLGVVKPTVGILNVGIETIKGNDVVRSAARVLESGRLPIEFHGFVEGDDITRGTVDVVVTDGFTGNVALKTAEGTARLYSAFLRAAFRQSLLARLGYLFARRALHSVRDRLDPRRYNGGMLLGLNGVVVKSHGGTDVLGFANAIGFAVDMAKHGFNDKVTAEIHQLHADLIAETKAAAV